MGETLREYTVRGFILGKVMLFLSYEMAEGKRLFGDNVVFLQDGKWQRFVFDIKWKLIKDVFSQTLIEVFF